MEPSSQRRLQPCGCSFSLFPNSSCELRGLRELSVQGGLTHKKRGGLEEIGKLGGQPRAVPNAKFQTFFQLRKGKTTSTSNPKILNPRGTPFSIQRWLGGSLGLGGGFGRCQTACGCGKNRAHPGVRGYRVSPPPKTAGTNANHTVHSCLSVSRRGR
jgi:hypothetical protein